MNNKKDVLLFKYIRDRRTFIFALISIFTIYIFVAYLYSIDFEPVAYSILLSLVLILAIGINDYLHIRQAHLLLTSLSKHLTVTRSNLPEPSSHLEADYQALIQKLVNEGQELISSHDSSQTELIDYFTLWAHQIKTPIAAMRIYLQSCEETTDKNLLQQLFKIEQYVEMVLSFLRIESPTSDLLIASYDLDGIVKQSIKKYATSFIGQKITLNFTPLNTKVITDEKWLVFALEQLLSNALKYTPKGSISIYMLTEDLPEYKTYFELSGKTREKVLVIRDTGMGISSEDLPRIFDKGYTGYNGRKDKKATGIGLYLTKKILSKLSHHISIASTPDKGTMVFIDLSSEGYTQ